MSLQLLVFIGLVINPLLNLFPLLGKDAVVLQDSLFDNVGCCLEFLMTLLSICLDPSDLHAVGPPLPLSIVHLKKWISKANKKPYICFLPHWR